MATEITSRGNRNPAKAETKPEEVTADYGTILASASTPQRDSACRAADGRSASLFRQALSRSLRPALWKSYTPLPL